MATSIGKLTLQLTANSEGMKADLDKAGNAANDFGDRIGSATSGTKAIDELNTKVGDTTRGMFEAKRAAHQLTGGLTDLTSGGKGIGEITHALGDMTKGLAKAMRSADGLRRTLSLVAIDLAIKGVAAFDEWLSAGKVAETVNAKDRPKAELDEKVSKRLERMGIIREGERPTVTDTGGAHVSRDHGFLGFRTSDESFDLSKEVVDLAKLADATKDAGGRLDELTRAAGRTADEMTLLDAEARLASLPSVGKAWRDLAADADHLRASVLAAKTAVMVTRFGDIASSARESAATIGMSGVDAALHRASLRSVTRTVGSTTFTETRAISAEEAHARRVDETREAYLRGSMTIEAYRVAVAASTSAMHDEILIRGEARSALMAEAGARATLAAMTEGDRSLATLREMTDLLRVSAISAETFGRTMERSLGIAAAPIDTFIARIEALRAAAATPIPLTIALPDASAPLAGPSSPLMDLIPSFLRRLGSARIEGGAPAIDAARAASDRAELIRGLVGETRTPMERLSSRLADLDRGEMAARPLLGVRADWTPIIGELSDREREMFDRSRASAFEDATRGISLAMPGGPGALDFGSAGAISAIHEAMRAGPTDPAERAAATLERIREMEGMAATDRRAIRDALRDGRIVLAPGPRV